MQVRNAVEQLNDSMLAVLDIATDGDCTSAMLEYMDKMQDPAARYSVPVMRGRVAGRVSTTTVTRHETNRVAH